MTPKEQFYVTDYQEFRRGDNNRLIDVGSGRYADQVGRSLLHDIDGVIHPNEFQNLTYGINVPLTLTGFDLQESIERRQAQYNMERQR